MDKFGFSGSQISRSDVFQLLIRVSFASVITYYTAKWMMNQLDPTSKNMRKAKIRAQEQMKRLCDQEDFKIDSEKFSDYELMIASHIVVPSDISVSWKDIAGLDSIIQDLRESVVLPVQHRHLFQQSKLWHPPKGVLLHGPPGCGKTLIAKATAKEAGMRFINLDVSVLTDKWYGESQKLASAVFSLALKVQPCIIFIDEIDSFLRSRNSNDHEATAMMKTQFMMLWDGLSTNSNATVMVMGATNRPQDLDKAIIRRMPAQFHIGLPNMEQRRQILKLVLDTEVHNNVDYDRLSKITNGFSGSDLREMCRNASVLRMRQYLRSNLDSPSNVNQANTSKNNVDLTAEVASNGPMSICMEDLISSFDKIQESKIHTGQLLMEHRIDLD